MEAWPSSLFLDRHAPGNGSSEKTPDPFSAPLGLKWQTGCPPLIAGGTGATRRMHGDSLFR